MTVPAYLLTATEAAQHLGPRGEQRLKELVQEGRLKAFRFPGGAAGFFAADLDALTSPMPIEEAIAQLEQPQGPAMVTSMVPAKLVSEMRHLIRQILDQEIAERSQRAKWVTVKQASTLFSIDRERLLSWVRKGLVKQAKLGATQQSPSLFKAQDIEHVLEELASGKLNARSL